MGTRELVERLREFAKATCPDNVAENGTRLTYVDSVIWLAADEISRLSASRAENARLREATIEECAVLAEEWEPLETLLPFCDASHNEAAHTGQYEAGERIAAAIRALSPKAKT